MSTNYLITVETGLDKAGELIRAVTAPCGGTGSGICDTIQTDYCEFPINCRLLVTFGGALSGITPFVITYNSGLGGWGWASGDRFLSTSCGVMNLFEFLPQSGGVGYSLSFGFTNNSGAEVTASPLYCPLVVGIPPDTEPFTWESGDLTLSEAVGDDPCPGTFTVTITEVAAGSGSGPVNSYLLALETGRASAGTTVLAAVNCAGSSPVMYRLAGDTGLTKDGKIVLFAEENPCCDGGIPVIVNCDPPFTLPRILWVTVTGITHAGYPISETHQLIYQPSSGLWALVSTTDGNCMFNTGAGALGAAFSITPEDCGMVFTTTNSFDTWGTILQPGSATDPLFAEFSQTGNPVNPFEPATFCAGAGNSLTFTVTETAP